MDTRVSNRLVMHPKKEHLPLLHAFSNLCQRAYCSWHLVASPVLAKVCLADLFREYEKGGTPHQASKLFLLSKVILYYVKGVGNFTLLLCCKVAHTLSAQKAIIPQKRTVFIDSYFLIPNFLKGEDVSGHYFPGIKQPIADAGWEHIMLPRFYGTRNPFQFYRMFRALPEYEMPVLTEFQILMLRDYIHLLAHILIYPWLILSLFKDVPRTREGRFISFAMANGLDNASFIGAVRYLMARRLAPLLPEHARCLQWFENQTFERCFNRGLREAGATMPVYGAQLFLWPPEIPNIHVDSNESALHKPDVILVNGSYYNCENVDPPCKIGPSIRYAHLFETFVTPTGNKKTLVLLSHFEAAARFTIEAAIQIEPPDRLMFKFHPAAPLMKLKRLIPPESVIVEGDIYDRFHETDLVIGSASGSLVEAAVVGIPVIVVTSEEGMTDYTYLPDIGKGLLWEAASSVKEIREAKVVLLEALLNRIEERMACIATLRTELFTRPTAATIMEMLDLLDGDSLPK